MTSCTAAHFAPLSSLSRKCSSPAPASIYRQLTDEEKANISKEALEAARAMGEVRHNGHSVCPKRSAWY